MADWTKSMQQTYEYYLVDPNTWKDEKKINTIKSCSITRDRTTETLGSASFDATEVLGECYIRVYLITIQNGIREKHPLGTYLVQTPSTSFNGRVQAVSMDAYTPLLELKEKKPDLGYSITKDTNVMERAYTLIRERMRAPVAKTETKDTLYQDFIADTEENFLTFLTALIEKAKYEFDLDELGRVLFVPKQETESLQPVWTFSDDNSSILLPDIDVDHDLYGVPNVVEVIYSNNGEFYYSRVVNDDPNSPTSTVSRGREILYRETSPSIIGIPTQKQIDVYAESLLKELSSISYSVSYTHGYCPVRTGDCVRLNYKKAGINDVKAKVISQTIKCDSGCQVAEKAVFTAKLWR